MTRTGISRFSYEHGGLPADGRGGAADGCGHSGIAAAGYHDGYGYDYTGLVRAMADRTP
jgi:hypothetical protein